MKIIGKKQLSDEDVSLYFKDTLHHVEVEHQAIATDILRQKANHYLTTFPVYSVESEKKPYRHRLYIPAYDDHDPIITVVDGCACLRPAYNVFDYLPSARHPFQNYGFNHLPLRHELLTVYGEKKAKADGFTDEDYFQIFESRLTDRLLGRTRKLPAKKMKMIDAKAAMPLFDVKSLNGLRQAEFGENYSYVHAIIGALTEKSVKYDKPLLTEAVQKAFKAIDSDRFAEVQQAIMGKLDSNILDICNTSSHTQNISAYNIVYNAALLRPLFKRHPLILGYITTRNPNFYGYDNDTKEIDFLTKEFPSVSKAIFKKFEGLTGEDMGIECLKKLPLIFTYFEKINRNPKSLSASDWLKLSRIIDIAKDIESYGQGKTQEIVRKLTKSGRHFDLPTPYLSDADLPATLIRTMQERFGQTVILPKLLNAVRLRQEDKEAPACSMDFRDACYISYGEMFTGYWTRRVLSIQSLRPSLAQQVMQRHSAIELLSFAEKFKYHADTMNESGNKKDLQLRRGMLASTSVDIPVAPQMSFQNTCFLPIDNLADLMMDAEANNHNLWHQSEKFASGDMYVVSIRSTLNNQALATAKIKRNEDGDFTIEAIAHHGDVKNNGVEIFVEEYLAQLPKYYDANQQQFRQSQLIKAVKGKIRPIDVIGHDPNNPMENGIMTRSFIDLMNKKRNWKVDDTGCLSTPALDKRVREIASMKLFMK